MMITDAQLLSLLDRSAISDVVIRFAQAFDMHDWALLRSCLMTEIETDYSDFRGEPPTVVLADDYVASRERTLSDVKTLHLSTNHQITIEDDHAICVSHAVIYRFLPELQDNNTYDTYGYYTHELKRTTAGWKISKIKQSVFWNNGNPAVHGAKRPQQ